MELLLEIVLEVYLGLVEIIMPEHKFKKWQETLLKIVYVVVSLLIIALIIAGICLLVESPMRTLGIALLVVGCVLLATQITLCVVVLIHQIKKDKAETHLPLSNIDET